MAQAQMRQSGVVRTWVDRTPVEDALARGTDDWLHVADFASIAKRFAPGPPEATRFLALGLIATVVFDGLMVLGDADELGFREWPLSPGDGLRRVAELWDPADLFPTPGAVAWLSNTERGDSIGQAVLERE